MRKIIFILLTAIVFVSCYKYSVVDLLGTTTSTLNCKECAYIPTCSGSIYTYNDTTGGTPTVRKDTTTFIKDTTIDGLSCMKVKNTSSATPSYYNCTNGVTTLFAYNVVTGGNTIPKLKRIFLKANSPVGTQWTDSVNNGGTLLTYKNEILYKGISITVNSKTYPDVIVVGTQTGTTVAGTYIAAIDQILYVAKNVGLVYTEMDNVITGSVIQTSGLANYYIP